MAVPLEQLADGSTSDRNFQKLAALVPDMGGQSLGFRLGTTTAVFTASGTSATRTVTHGLGRAPQGVWLQVVSGSTNSVAYYVTGSATATTFQLFARTFDASTPTATTSIFWLVIG